MLVGPHLVGHQTDEGRDADRDSPAPWAVLAYCKYGQLVAETFAPSRRHHDHAVAFGQNSTHHL